MNVRHSPLITPLICFITVVLCAAPAHGDIVWTGKAGNNLFYDAGNWDFSHSKMSADQFAKCYDVTDNLVFKNTTASIKSSPANDSGKSPLPHAALRSG